MTNLITEARELCEKWSLSDYAVFECEDCIANMVIYKVVELCDALEKAQKRIKLLEGAGDRQNNTIAYLSSTNGQGFNW